MNLKFKEYVECTTKDMKEHTRNMVNGLICCSRQMCNTTWTTALNFDRNFYQRRLEDIGLLKEASKLYIMNEQNCSDLVAEIHSAYEARR